MLPKFNKRRIWVLFSLISLLVSMSPAACGNETPAVVDYSKPERWLSIPAAVDKPVDVFYLYPTTYSKANKADPNIGAIDNPSMLAGAKLVFARQATAFETVGNIYAPYYRQADALYKLTLPLDEQDKVERGIPKADVFAAFDYYIKNYNTMEKTHDNTPR